MAPQDDPADVELERTGAEWPGPPPLPRAIAPWVMLAALVLAVGTALYLVSRPKPATPTAPAAATNLIPPSAASSPAATLAPPAEPIALPPLDDSDRLVRSLVRALVNAPAVEAWLAGRDLIRGFVTVIANVADGETPAKHLSALRPRTAFRVKGRAGHLEIDPQSYERYTWVADAVASVEPKRAARLYATLRPLVNEAGRALGEPDATFDRTLMRALDSLMRAPVVEEPVRVIPKGIGYAYEDGRLEDLTAAQKQLLRMGPRNVRRVQDQLKAIAVALAPAGERQ